MFMYMNMKYAVCRVCMKKYVQHVHVHCTWSMRYAGYVWQKYARHVNGLTKSMQYAVCRVCMKKVCTACTQGDQELPNLTLFTLHHQARSSTASRSFQTPHWALQSSISMKFTPKKYILKLFIFSTAVLAEAFKHITPLQWSVSVKPTKSIFCDIIKALHFLTDFSQLIFWIWNPNPEKLLPLYFLRTDCTLCHPWPALGEAPEAELSCGWKEYLLPQRNTFPMCASICGFWRRFMIASLHCTICLSGPLSIEFCHTPSGHLVWKVSAA